MKKAYGFTLIELSIVLVIIGLIIGGVLSGKTLIEMAEIRAQVSQIEQYQLAVKTFRLKYDCLPGDCKDAAKYGFIARGQFDGEGDGNGVIQGTPTNQAGYASGTASAIGETVTFWVDLSAAQLINESFITGSETTCSGHMTNATTPALNDFFPAAKLKQGNYIFVVSGGTYNPPWSNWRSTGINYFQIEAIDNVNSCWALQPASYISLTPQQAYMIDSKIDDGLPQSGSVLAQYVYNLIAWAGAADNVDFNAGLMGTPTVSAIPGSSGTCYDNGNTANTTQRYSIALNTVTRSCGLNFSFK